MRRLAFLLAAASLTGCPAEPPPEPPAAEAPAAPTLADDRARLSYAIGYDIGQNFERQEVDVDLDLVRLGMGHATTDGAAALMTDEERAGTVRTHREQQRAAQAEKRKKDAEVNKTAGAAFLAENGKRPGVVTTASGLQYEVITPGAGKKPGPTSNVTVHYRGTLIDGTEFDSSYSRGTPASFGVSGVIKGWTEALQLMGEGSKYKLAIPSDLAYGPRGSPPKIGPDAVLVFEVELISVDPG